MIELQNLTDEQLAAVDFDKLAENLLLVYEKVGTNEDLEDSEKTTVLAGATFGALIGIIKVLALHQRNNRERDRLLATSV